MNSKAQLIPIAILFILIVVIFSCEKRKEKFEPEPVIEYSSNSLEEMRVRNDPARLDQYLGIEARHTAPVHWGNISEYRDLISYPMPWTGDADAWATIDTNSHSSVLLQAFSHRPNDLRMGTDTINGDVYYCWAACAEYEYLPLGHELQMTEILWMESPDSMFVKFRPYQGDVVAVWPYALHQHALWTNDYGTNGTALAWVITQSYDASTDTWTTVDQSNASRIEMYGNGGPDLFESPLISQPPIADTLGWAQIYGGSKFQDRDETPLEEYGFFRLSGSQDGCDSSQWEMNTFRVQMIWEFHAKVWYDSPGLPDYSEGTGWGWVRREDQLCVENGFLQPYPWQWAGAYNNAYEDSRPE